MELKLDALQSQMPSYLTQDAKENLVKALNDFCKKDINYYTTLFNSEILQGDGWTELGLIRLETAERKQIWGIILSNSCDISPDNTRGLPARVVFVPLIKLKAYAVRLEKAQISQKAITDKLNTIREQKITNIFYLPKGASLGEEYIAVLDDIYSVPFQNFFKQEKRKKLFTLSQVGFYLFLFKLSIHFCRFHENLLRDGQGAKVKL